MAQIFPNMNKTRVIFASKAEEDFYNTCAKGLDDSWQVYSSCTLSTIESGKGLMDNEIDFVIYHPKWGIIVVEVKGGRIKYDSEIGEFYSIDRYDKAHQIENPFKQVLLWKSRFVRYLRKENIKVPVSHAVSFPTAAEREFFETTVIKPQLIIGINGMQEIEKTLARIAGISQHETYLKFDDVGEEIDKILRGAHFTTRMHIRNYLDNHELRLKDIELITETLVTPIVSTRRLGIEGEAGTGKTILAVMISRLFRDSGKQVLFLSSNQLMNSYLKEEVGKDVEVKTYSELASEYGLDLMRKPAAIEGSEEDWTQYVGPERLKKAIEAKSRWYDVIVCDEAQDVQPFWWEAFESLLKPDEESRFYLFFDRSQGIFGSGSAGSSFIPDNVLPVKPPYFPLVHNYRMTREIAGFSRSFRTGKEILQSHCGRFGYKPELIIYESGEDFKRNLKLLLRKLFEEEGLSTEEVTLLSARSPFTEGSVLDKSPAVGTYQLLEISAPNRKKTMPTPQELKGRIKLSTIHAFKGLETPIGIIINMSEYNLPLNNPIMASLFYVACTRAKHMLYVMLRRDDPKREPIEKALGKIVQTGSMLLERSIADYEYSGRVTYYNPDRIGWLHVDDPAFEKKDIMFFPYDIAKTGLPGVEMGMELRFRPRMEGRETIAGDLHLP